MIRYPSIPEIFVEKNESILDHDIYEEQYVVQEKMDGCNIAIQIKNLQHIFQVVISSRNKTLYRATVYKSLSGLLYHPPKWIGDQMLGFKVRNKKLRFGVENVYVTNDICPQKFFDTEHYIDDFICIGLQAQRALSHNRLIVFGEYWSDKVNKRKVFDKPYFCTFDVAIFESDYTKAEFLPTREWHKQLASSGLHVVRCLDFIPRRPITKTTSSTTSIDSSCTKRYEKEAAPVATTNTATTAATACNTVTTYLHIDGVECFTALDAYKQYILSEAMNDVERGTEEGVEEEDTEEEEENSDDIASSSHPPKSLSELRKLLRYVPVDDIKSILREKSSSTLREIEQMFRTCTYAMDNRVSLEGVVVKKDCTRTPLSERTTLKLKYCKSETTPSPISPVEAMVHNISLSTKRVNNSRN